MRDVFRGYCLENICGGQRGRGGMGLREKLGYGAVTTRARSTLLIGPLKDVLRRSEEVGHLLSWINQALHVDCSVKRA